MEAWLAEDIGRGDLTAAALQGQQGQAHWVAKQPGRFCGGPLVQRLFQRLDPGVSLRLLRQDGDAVEVGDCLLELQGPAKALVAGERTALNLAMRLSGIATATAALVAQLEGTGVRLADTRKTTPGLRLLRQDGDAVEAGDCLLELQGPAAALVAGERTALNLAMRLSGIATATAELVAQLQGTGVRLADTRKTTPGLRLLEKYAVRCGGGINHRMGLDDAAMLKENHIAWAGGITAAIAAVREQAPWPTAVIVEAETEAQALEAVQAGANGVLLDEFSPEQLTQLVPRLRDCSTGVVVLEASGIQPEQLQAYAATGIDLISTSAPVTRSRWLDLSMRFT